MNWPNPFRDIWTAGTRGAYACLQPLLNKAENGAFEDGDPPERWIGDGTSGLVLSASGDAHSGTQSLSVYIPSGSGSCSQYTLDVVSGRKYRFSIWMKKNTAFGVRAVLFQAVPYTSLYSTGIVSPSDWTNYYFEFSADFTGRCIIVLTAVNGAGLFDDAELSEYVVPSTMDGIDISIVSKTILRTSPGEWYGRAAIEIVGGVVILVYKHSSAHGANDGELHIKFSDDYGGSWTDEDIDILGSPVTGFPMNPNPKGANEDATEPWLIVAPNGNLLLHMWRHQFGVSSHGTHQSISTDGGRTWSAPTQINFTGTTNDDNIFMTDDHFVYDGVIYAGARSFDNPTPTNSKCILCKSSDNGATWEYVSDIGSGGVTNDTTEVGIEYLGNNRIIAILRTLTNTDVYQTYSYDMGLTWSENISINKIIQSSGRHRIQTMTHLQGGADWWNDQNLVMCGFEIQPGTGYRLNSLWFSSDSGLHWTRPRYSEYVYNDAGYGYMFWDPLTSTIVFISYRGTVSEADIVQCRISV